MPSKPPSPESLAAYRAKGPDYRPRTRHLKTDGSPRYINRLILESSPYLLQHAHNPVDWQAWSPEAFALAKAQRKPIFLSIGYATCHWCHVMEEESFEDPAVAAFLNANFIPVKVDREERPAVDDYYMTAVQLLTGHGGWPMSTFLTPEGKPFFGGTYYPKAAFLALLKRVADVWQKNPEALQKQANELDKAISGYLAARTATTGLDASASHQAVDNLLNMHDSLQGGFGTAPKFPQETWLAFMQDMAARSGDDGIIQALDNTLAAMQQGGIHDQVGGGFHRYATDPAWLVPHFEKMGYNQAQLAEIYTTAWQQHGRLEDKRTAMGVLDYLLRDMHSPSGGFFSASDADSLNTNGERQEGAYFTWSLDEFRAALKEEEPTIQRLAERIYPLSRTGHFEGRNILHRRKNLPALAAEFSMALPELLTTLERINQRLLTARNRRPKPLLDKKIITAWNAHTVRALAGAATAFKRPDYLQAAQHTLDFLWRHHRLKNNGLIRSSLAGSPGHLDAQLEDYAQMLLALLQLYDSTGNDDWLHKAEQLYHDLPASLSSPSGGFYDNPVEAGIPWQRRLQKSADGATPSGQALMLQALAKLWHRTGKAAYAQRFQQALKTIAGSVAQAPLSHASTLLAMHWMNEGEMSPIAYAGGGRIRLQARRADTHRFSLQLQVAPGWHITAHDDASAQAFALATPASGGVILDRIQWPDSRQQSLTFQEQPLKTWSGEITIQGQLLPADTPLAKASPKETPPSPHKTPHPEQLHGLPLRVRLQACSDTTCLPPETLTVWLPASD